MRAFIRAVLTVMRDTSLRERIEPNEILYLRSGDRELSISDDNGDGDVRITVACSINKEGYSFLLNKNEVIYLKKKIDYLVNK